MNSSFHLALQAFAKKAEDAANEVVGEVITALVRKIDYASPVGDPTTWKNPAPKGYVGGHFRANWQLGIDHAPQGIVEGIDAEGAATVARNIAVIPEKAWGHKYTLTNNLPYAIRLEYGWSPQSPPGAMVAQTVEAFDALVREAAGAVA